MFNSSKILSDMHHPKCVVIGLLMAIGLQSFPAAAQKTDPGKGKPQLWLTDPDGGVLFKQQDQNLNPLNTLKSVPAITIDDTKTYQQMDGFGFALTGGSAMLINKMSASKQAELLKELFGVGKNDIGVSYLRISIGASDLDDHVFSYDDLPAGETDAGLKKFSLANDKRALIPVLKKILAIAPPKKIIG
jgi:glucosylceramidase